MTLYLLIMVCVLSAGFQSLFFLETTTHIHNSVFFVRVSHQLPWNQTSALAIMTTTYYSNARIRLYVGFIEILKQKLRMHIFVYLNKTVSKICFKEERMNEEVRRVNENYKKQRRLSFFTFLWIRQKTLWISLMTITSTSLFKIRNSLTYKAIQNKLLDGYKHV
jgi:hypothetical protein